MTRIATFLSLAAAAALVATSAAHAEPSERFTQRLAKQGLSGAQALPNNRTFNLSGVQTTANVSSAVRFALVFNASGSGSISRSKNISYMDNPSAGLYCIRPTGLTSTAVSRLVPQLTGDIATSASSVVLVSYNRANGCQSNEISVRTKRLVNGSFVNSDFVGFTMIAP